MKKLLLLLVLIAGTVFIAPSADAQPAARENARVSDYSKDGPRYHRHHKKGRKHFKKHHRHHKHDRGHQRNGRHHRF